MLYRTVFGRLSVLLFALFLVIPAAAQVFIPPGATDTGLGGGNAISGSILASTGQRLERRVSVRLQTPTKGDRVTMTDEYGTFNFRGLPTGDYVLVIDKEKDYQTASQAVTVIQPRGFPAQTYVVNIRLVPKAGEGPKPGVVNADAVNIPKAALDLYNKGVELAKLGDRKAAITQFEAAIAQHKDFMLAYNEMGVQYLRLNELVKADETLQAALKLKPDAFAPLMNRGIVLVTMKKYDEAEPVLRKAVELKSDAAVTHYFLGQALANLGKFDEAEKELSIAVTTGGAEMKEAYRLLAIIYHSKGDKKRAAAQLEKYLQLNPTTPDAEQLRKVIDQYRTTASAKPTQ
jgi:tetratricopeptide (TPR) repeat protein